MNEHESLDDEYLFEGTGTPDPHVAHLEALLAPLAYARETPPAAVPTSGGAWRLRIACGVLAVVGAVAFWQTGGGPTTPAPAWDYVLLAPGAEPDMRSLAVGGWIETGRRDRAELEVADIGQLTLEPGSRMQLVATGRQEHRLRLERGRMEAIVVAPPRLFVTETPAGDAVDMGCRYTLDVDEHGNGALHVTLGLVMFEREGRESYVPYGARCEARKDQGLGTPYFTTASGALRAALRRLDFEETGTKALPDVLEVATVRDTLTLWNLLQHPRLSRAERGTVLTRIEDFVELPVEIDRATVLDRHEDALVTLRVRLERYW